MIVRPEKWIRKPDENGDGLLKVWAGSGIAEFPLPIETRGVSFGDAALHQDRDFEIILECAEKPAVYRDEESYMAADGRFSMAPESVIPIGLLSLPYDARVMLNGTVAKTCEDPTGFGFDKGDMLFSLTCLGNEYDAVLPAELTEGVGIKPGNIVSCVYWVQGWPAEDE